MNPTTRTHKATGWQRESLRNGSGCWRVIPTDGSGERIVRFLSAGSWQNDPADDQRRIREDRIVLISGEPLPAWAQTWLENANAKACEKAREAFGAAMADADDAPFRHTGW